MLVLVLAYFWASLFEHMFNSVEIIYFGSLSEVFMSKLWLHFFFSVHSWTNSKFRKVFFSIQWGLNCSTMEKFSHIHPFSFATNSYFTQWNLFLQYVILYQKNVEFFKQKMLHMKKPYPAKVFMTKVDNFFFRWMQLNSENARSKRIK